MPILTDLQGKIAQITINRPEKRNTLDEKMCDELAQAFLNFEKDSHARSIVLCGQSSIFCAGLDIEEQIKTSDSIHNAFQTVIDAMDSINKPIVAAVNGPAVNEGVALLFHSDLAFCGEHALFSLPSVALGLTPQYGITLLSVRSAGYKLAAQKILLSEPISPSEAVAMGMVNRVVEDSTVMTVASAAALRLATLPPQSLRETKRLLKASYTDGMADQRVLEKEIFNRLLGGPENKEAFNAFMEKRPPKFDD